MKTGDFDNAIADYSRAIGLNPKFAKAFNNRAVAYLYKNEYEKAWDDVIRAQALGHLVKPRFLQILHEAKVSRK